MHHPFFRVVFLGLALGLASLAWAAHPKREVVATADSHTMVDEAVLGTPTASAMARLLDAAGFLPALSRSGETWTVLLPPDSSFPEGLEQCLVRHPDLLRVWVGRHVFNARLAPALPFDGVLPLKSLGGVPVALSFDGGTMRFDGVAVVGDPARYGNGNLLAIEHPLALNEVGPCARPVASAFLAPADNP
jgi:hypothetical protein